MKILAVIPARFQSSRFPGKPLALIGGKTMIQWIYEAATSEPVFDHVLVATDHQGIYDAVQGFGGAVEMTRSDHPTGTDRVAEVAARHPQFDVVANVQGDQPFVTAAMLRALVQPFREGQAVVMSTLACPLAAEAVNDPNSVKVVCDRKMRALYFSRASIPYYRERHPAPVYHHLGLYAFQRDFLPVYAGLTPTPLERCEQLEQLRALENGYAIQVGLTERPVLEVNTPEDLERANAQLQA